MQHTAGAHALEYAGFWRRFAAFFIDAIILGMIIRVLFPFSFWNVRNAWYLIPIVAISNLVSTAITVAYSVIFWAWRGQTLGKMVMNIKVLRVDGSNITPGYALLRYLGYVVCFLIVGLGFLWIPFDSRKQGIHDKIADTVVVKLPEPTRTQHAMATPRPSAG
jgi:uncharacterized RDD family membrane protein YckC